MKLIVFLVDPALRSLALGCVAALVLALLRVRRASLRLHVWTAVLYISLAMPLLGAFLPRMMVAVPGILAADAPVPAVVTHAGYMTETAAIPGTALHALAPAITRAHAQSGAMQASSSSPKPTFPPSAIAANSPANLLATLERVNWRIIAALIYFLGFTVLLARVVLGLLWSRRLVHSAQDVCARYFPRLGEAEDAQVCGALNLLACHSHRAGLDRPPHLKESAALSVPATAGLRRPSILLPNDWRAWTQGKLEAVLAHEVSHVARRDARTQLFSLLHRAIFWFSPLGWWINRQLTELAEQASDEAALAGGVDRTRYAETLLGFFAQLESVPGRVRWHALSMAKGESTGHAERRVDRILAWKETMSMKKPIVIVLIALSVPVIFLAASIRPFIAHAQDKTPSSAPSQTVPASSLAPPASRETAATAAPLLAAQEAAANAERDAEQAAKDAREATNININSDSYKSGPRYVIMSGDSKNVSVSGSDEDLQHALHLAKKINGDFAWFERDEKSYIITDPAFIARAKALFAPEDELGRKQDALGRQQDELGRQQDALGEQIDKSKVKVPDITAELERIRARLKEFQAGATQAELGRVQAQLGELQGRIGRLQSEAGGNQLAIARQQAELGRRQGELGRQQGELGRQQGEISRRASRELRGMFDDAITKGIAKPE